MVKLERPNESFDAKFVTVGDKVHVTQPDDLDTHHKDLARTDGILDEVKRLRDLRSPEVDGGLITVNTPLDGKPGTITVLHDSLGLRIPVPEVTEEARRRTVEKVQKIVGPDFKVQGRLPNK